MIGKSLLAVLFVAILVACGLSKHKTTDVEPVPQDEAKPAKTDGIPDQSDVDRVQAKFPGYTLDDLNKGKSLYEGYCAICHELKAPASESESEWRKIVPPMVKKANGKTNNAIDAKGEEQILRYVITMGPALGK